jgi:methionine aminopeptidase
MMTRVKTAKEIQAMRESGKMLATILQLLKNYVNLAVIRRF